MELISKAEVLKRKGWNEDKIIFFLGKELYIKEEHGYILSKINRVENAPIFQKFTDINSAIEIKELTESNITKNNTEAIARFFENVPHVDKNFSLLNQIEKYQTETGLNKEIIHWINKENINIDDKYDLFTDGSLKIEGDKNIIGCSGWIRNQNGNCILEFTKKINEDSVSSFYNFEIFGLEIGLKIAQSLGIKNLNVYSDSSGEMKTLSFMKEGFLNERMVDLAEIYLPMQEIIKDMNIKFSYIPRDLNYHADALSKVYMEEFKNYLKTIFQTQKENGYLPEINEPQYYTNNKIENLTTVKTEGILFVQRYIEKKFYQFYIDMKNNEVINVEILQLKEIKQQLIKENFNFRDGSSGLEEMQLALLTKEIIKNTEIGNKELNVVHLSLGIKCRIENIVMVTNDWKEAYLKLDKEIKKLDKINFIPLTDNLMKLTKNWIAQNNIKENNKSIANKI